MSVRVTVTEPSGKLLAAWQTDSSGRRVPVHFCSGPFCPGLRWPASNTPHPTSCAIERLNSAEGLREAAECRRAHGRAVSWE